MISLCCLAETLSVTLKGSLTFKTSALQMQAIIKSCNMPQTGSKLNEKNKKFTDVCIVND